MPSVLYLLSQRITTAIQTAFGQAAEEVDPAVAAASDPKFGHYQCNAAMTLARRVGQKPREVAMAIIDALDYQDLFEEPEVAGPGFINFRMKPEFLTDQLKQMLLASRLNIQETAAPQRVVVDFSSPNIAKELHVGHLRSTIIGDCIARTLEFIGHDVLRRNHVGDWGTQFGMLLTHLKVVCPEALQPNSTVELGDLVAFYRAAKRRFDEDSTFKEQARLEVVNLQSGQTEAVNGWKSLCEQSRKQFDEIYSLLGVQIEEKGESFYNPFIPSTIEELREKNLVVESDGAQCVYPEGFKNKEGDPLPLIIQKRDGGFNYDTTDMAAIRYRIRDEKADRIIYVTDAGQAQHFAMIFEAARMAGWLEGVEAVHVPFGMVLGEDRKKFKTRSGDTVRLRDLLDEAVARARAMVEEKNAGLPDEKQDEIARAIGIGAVKYADLSQHRLSDYVFSFDKMLALNGNTAPYLIYAYVRVRSIVRKGEVDLSSLDWNAMGTLETPEEMDLGKTIVRFPEVLKILERELLPNRLTDYLYELAQLYSRFYTNNRVLGDPRELTRLALCELTARTMKTGLALLGISVIEEM